MKKQITLALVMILALSLAACGGNNKLSGNSGTSAPPVSSGNNNGGNDTAPAQAGAVSGSDMEKKVAGYLSAIGGPGGITLCGGKSIEFEPANEWLGMYGDSWEITNPDMSYADLMSSIDGQLTASGFSKTGALLGWQWTVRAGVQSIGLMLGNEEGDTITIYMTHAPECYSGNYIAEQEAIMPKIIPGLNALEAFPENFSITWKSSYNAYKTLCRKDGSWFYGYDGRESDDPSNWAFYSAAILQADGSYLYYQWDSDDSSPGNPTDWVTSSNENVDDLLSDVLDYDAMTDVGTPSTWLQMCYDYANPDQSDLPFLRYEISNSMMLEGTENIAGVKCDVVVSDSMFMKTEFAYDPNTGILFRFGTLSKGGGTEEIPYSYTVTEYTDAPATLGVYPG